MTKQSVTQKRHKPRNKQQESVNFEQNDEILFGKHAVLTHLSNNQQSNKLFVQKDLPKKNISDILKLAREQRVIVQEVPKTKLDNLTHHAVHQGVVLTTPPYVYKELEDCQALAEERGEQLFLMVLDGVEDPHNLGSIIRSADAAGVHGIIIPKRRSAAVTGVVAKTSAGAIERVPIVRVSNIVQCIESLKKLGVWVFATAMQGQDMREWKTDGSIAIVIGNEGKGVSPIVQQACDGIVTIPMTGEMQSLNASVAAAILMYEVSRHRLPIK